MFSCFNVATVLDEGNILNYKLKLKDGFYKVIFSNTYHCFFGFIFHDAPLELMGYKSRDVI